MRQEMESSDHKSKDFYQQRISEQEIKLSQHEEALQKFNQSLTENHEAFEKIKT